MQKSKSEFQFELSISLTAGTKRIADYIEEKIKESELNTEPKQAVPLLPLNRKIKEKAKIIRLAKFLSADFNPDTKKIFLLDLRSDWMNEPQKILPNNILLLCYKHPKALDAFKKAYLSKRGNQIFGVIWLT